jgi:hypothetical protein
MNLRGLLRVERTQGAYARIFGNLGNPDVRALVADLSRYCNLYRTTACISKATGTMDPIAMAFAEGQRDAFLYLLRQSNADPSAVQAAIQQELEDAA